MRYVDSAQEDGVKMTGRRFHKGGRGNDCVDILKDDGL